MSDVTWDPDPEKPPDAATLENEIRRVAPGAQVKITLVEGRWLVRALGPPAMCSRGVPLSGRDVSGLVAETLSDNGVPAGVFRKH